MKKIAPFRWFRNISIARKLYFTVGIMAMLILVELIVLFFSISTLSSIRALVGAEGLWSKAQKNAVRQLSKYGRTGNEADYIRFLEYMKVPLGIHTTITELNSAHPDWQRAANGLLQGRNHPDDIKEMIRLLSRFRSNAYIRKAITAWSEADKGVLQLVPIANSLHVGQALPNDFSRKLPLLEDLDERLTSNEDEFSFALGEGSRWMERVILRLLFGIALTIEITGLTLALTVSREIQKGLHEILLSAKFVAKNNFTRKARVFGHDEIGELAVAFNAMSGELERSAKENELALRECLKLLGIHGSNIKEKLGRPNTNTGGQ